MASTRFAVIEIGRVSGVAAVCRNGLQPSWLEVARESSGTLSSLAFHARQLQAQALTARRCCTTLMTPGYLPLRPIYVPSFVLGGRKTARRLWTFPKAGNRSVLSQEESDSRATQVYAPGLAALSCPCLRHRRRSGSSPDGDSVDHGLGKNCASGSGKASRPRGKRHDTRSRASRNARLLLPRPWPENGGEIREPRQQLLLKLAALDDHCMDLVLSCKACPHQSSSRKPAVLQKVWGHCTVVRSLAKTVHAGQ